MKTYYTINFEGIQPRWRQDRATHLWISAMQKANVNNPPWSPCCSLPLSTTFYKPLCKKEPRHGSGTSQLKSNGQTSTYDREKKIYWRFPRPAKKHSGKHLKFFKSGKETDTKNIFPHFEIIYTNELGTVTKCGVNLKHSKDWERNLAIWWNIAH